MYSHSLLCNLMYEDTALRFVEPDSIIQQCNTMRAITSNDNTSQSEYRENAMVVSRTSAANGTLYKQARLISQNVAKHHNKRVLQLQDLVHLGLDRFTRCATELILLLYAPAALNGYGVIHLVIVLVFVR